MTTEPVHRVDSPKGQALGRPEIMAGIILSLLVVYAHFTFFLHAGGLWRDEANSIHLATLPTLSDIFSSLQFDTHPALYPLLLRGWSFVFGSTADTVVRSLGLAAGIGLAGIFWFNGRWLGFGVPLFSLTLFFQNPSVVRFVDSARPYGFGIAFSMLGYGLMWKMIESKKPGYFIGATATMILSVHCLYQSMLTLAALCLGGLFTTIWLRDKKGAGLVLGVLCLTSISFLPYIAILRETAAWSALNQSAFYSNYIFTSLLTTLGTPHGWTVWIWVIALGSGLGGSLILLRKTRGSETGRRGNARVLFCAVTMAAGIVLNLWFFRQFEMRPFPWHYLPMLAVVSLSLDAILVPFLRRKPWRGVAMAAMVALTVVSFTGMQAELGVRSTNVDLVAERLNALAKKGDYILVNPWHYGVSFSRYYRGEADWSTIPPIRDIRLHRYDQLKEEMQSPDPMLPALNAIARTLKAGRTIWVAGDLGPLEQYSPTEPMTPAPHPMYGWNCVPYLRSWLTQTGSYLRRHTGHSTEITIPEPAPVRGIENLHLTMLSGWVPE